MVTAVYNSRFFAALGVSFKQEDLFVKSAEVVALLEKIFKTKSRNEWTEIFKGYFSQSATSFFISFS